MFYFNHPQCLVLYPVIAISIYTLVLRCSVLIFQYHFFRSFAVICISPFCPRVVLQKQLKNFQVDLIFYISLIILLHCDLRVLFQIWGNSQLCDALSCQCSKVLILQWVFERWIEYPLIFYFVDFFFFWFLSCRNLKISLLVSFLFHHPVTKGTFPFFPPVFFSQKL